MSLSPASVGTIAAGLIILALAWALLRSPAAPAPESAASPGLTVQRDGFVRSDSAAPVTGPATGPVIASTHVSDPTPARDPEPAPKITPVAPPTTGPSERLVADSSPVPTGGKPVAPVDVAWQIRVSEDGQQAFSGVLKCIPRSDARELSVQCTAVDGAVLTSPNTPPGAVAHAGQTLSFPLSGQLTAGRGALIVMVTLHSYDVRSRVVRIELSDSGPSLKDTPTLPSGVELVTDSNGGTTLLMPAVPPPPRP